MKKKNIKWEPCFAAMKFPVTYRTIKKGKKVGEILGHPVCIGEFEETKSNKEMSDFPKEYKYLLDEDDPTVYILPTEDNQTILTSNLKTANHLYQLSGFYIISTCLLCNGPSLIDLFEVNIGV